MQVIWDQVSHVTSPIAIQGSGVGKVKLPGAWGEVNYEIAPFVT